MYGLIKQSRQGIFAVLNSVEIYRNRISLGDPVFCGPRMSENTLSALRADKFMADKGSKGENHGILL